MMRLIEAPIAFAAAIGSKKAAKVCGLLNRVRKWECNMYSRVTGNRATYTELEHRMSIDIIVYLLSIGMYIALIWMSCNALFK